MKRSRACSKIAINKTQINLRTLKYCIPIRKSLIIASPGKGDQYLHGPAADVENVVDHLCSEPGGLWERNEIKILWDPNWFDLKRAVKACHGDYTFTYYSGHGGTTGDGERLVYLKDKDVDDFSLLNESPRQLCLLDTCRDFEPPAISGLPDEKFLFEGPLTARQVFDHFILSSTPGIKIIHGTGAGFPAVDESSRKGGKFTLNLLKAATAIYRDKKFSPIQIEEIIGLASEYLKMNQSCQVPEIVYNEGNLQVPFSLFAPAKRFVSTNKTSNHRPILRSRQYMAKKQNNWLLPALVLAAIWYDNR